MLPKLETADVNKKKKKKTWQIPNVSYINMVFLCNYLQAKLGLTLEFIWEISALWPNIIEQHFFTALYVLFLFILVFCKGS